MKTEKWSKKSTFGTLSDGKTVTKYSLGNGSMEVDLINLGASIVSIRTPDRTGTVGDIVLGYDKASDYQNNSNFFGCVVGRYANRISGGQFELDGETYSLDQNEGEQCLHGGNMGFHRQFWEGRAGQTDGLRSVRFTYVSSEIEAGFPGELKVVVTYILTNENALIVRYQAETTAPTVLNLTQHSYFNLEGHAAGPITDHDLMIAADAFTPVDQSLLPTGELRSVASAPFDFRELKRVGEDIGGKDSQLVIGGGYDHNWCCQSNANLSPLDTRHPT